MLTVLVILQAAQVAFLWLHDWLPLGTLNDIPAVHAADSRARLVAVTIIQSLPFTLCLAFTLAHPAPPTPHWLLWWLWISYGFLFAGELRAWWIPYLFVSDPERANRYQAMFGKTHAFLPARNGIVPNTLHVALHACTAGTLVVLACLTVQSCRKSVVCRSKKDSAFLGKKAKRLLFSDVLQCY